MPRRDSCASALAPRPSPKARGLSKTQAAGISDASRAVANNQAATHMHGYVVAYLRRVFGAPRHRFEPRHPRVRQGYWVGCTR